MTEQADLTQGVGEGSQVVVEAAGNAAAVGAPRSSLPTMFLALAGLGFAGSQIYSQSDALKGRNAGAAGRSGCCCSSSASAAHSACPSAAIAQGFCTEQNADSPTDDSTTLAELDLSSVATEPWLPEFAASTDDVAADATAPVVDAAPVENPAAAASVE